jgi:hypothetical protein
MKGSSSSSSELSASDFGKLSIKIGNMLTREDRAKIVASVDPRPGVVDDNSRDTTSFLGYLSMQMLFRRDNLNLELWQDYPGVQALIREATRVPFEKLAFALADHFNEDSIEDFCGRFLSPPLQAREVAFFKHNTFGYVRKLFQEAYRKDSSLTIRGLARGFQECGYTECLRLLQDNGYAPKMDAMRPFLVEKNQHVEEEMQNPLAATLRQQRQQNLSTIAFLEDTTNHYRNALLTAMDECGAWKALLAKRGLLGGQQMEAWVAKLGREWTATRSNNPSWQVLQQLLLNDRDFAAGSLEELATALSGIGVDAAVANMVSFYCTRKDQQQAKSTEAFSAQNSLRAWLVPTVCDDGEADALVLKLRDAGVRNVEDLRDFDKDDLKEAGFNVRQANTVVRKMQEQKK